jgi:F-type H+-transporting ATPase subunit b
MINALFFAASAEGGNLVSELSHQFGVDGPKLLSQFIVFTVVAIVLKKFAFDPILKTLDERRTKIEEGLANAEKIKKELAEAEATRKDIIHKANDQANGLIAEATKAASVQGEKRLQEAVAQAEQVIKKANEATVLEREKMLQELKAEVASLVVDTTSKVAGKVLNADDQKRLNDETLVQLRS